MTANHSIVVDFLNHCLRSVNPQTGVTAPYAGRCDKAGFADGNLIGEALFSGPWNIASYNLVFYITDRNNNAVRMLTAGRVSTIIQGYSVFRYPTGLAFTVDDLAYITTDTRGLFQLNLRNKSVTKLTSGAGLAGSLSAAQLGYPHGLTFLSTSVLLITDAGKDHLLIANIRNNTINKICTGTQGTRDGGIRSCQLHDPYSVLIVNQSVFVGQDGAIRRLPIAALGGFIQPVESSMPVPGKDSSVYHPLMAP